MSARTWWMATVIVAIPALTAAAQTIAQRVDAVRDGTVEMTFDTRPGVCGDGRGSVWYEGRDQFSNGSRRTCIAGPVRVTLGRSEGQTVSVRTCVACAPRETGANPLGRVAARDAALYLIALARQNGRRNADDAITAAAFADAGDLSPELSALIRDQDATLDARKQALFWLCQSDAPTTSLTGLYSSLNAESLREHYTFVLSQRRDDEALDKLIDIAKRDDDIKVRRQAMFWLGQSHDPKALRFFKDILVR